MIPNSGTLKTYKALITQEGTAAPTVIELQNTLGDITWTRSDTGHYTGTLIGAFTAFKTFPTISNNRNNAVFYMYVDDVDQDTVTIRSKQDTFLSTDELLFITPITIEVHP